jgi:PPOX class probable F420-dependent enzyme
VTDAALSEPVRRFLAAPGRYATIATLDRDGAPHQAIIWYLLRDDHLVLNSRVGRRWPSNLQRDPRISFAVEEGEDAVTIAGLAELAPPSHDAQADIAEMAWRYYEPAMARREIARFQTEQRISFVVRPTRVAIHGQPG